VFSDAGLQVHRALADGVYELTFPLPTGEADAALGTYRDAVAARERSAGVASLRHVLTPASVAVIGVSRRPRSVGRTILRSILSGGFPGPVYAVNPAVTELDGAVCVPSAAALPDGIDLAVVAAPAGSVAGIAEECGRRGVKALVVIAAGLSGAARAELLGICRRHGMRMVALGWPTPAPGWTRRMRAAILSREALAWPCNRPAVPASPWPSTCPGWASGSPPSSRSATQTT
jgi:predicted CoA-binding protein